MIIKQHAAPHDPTFLRPGTYAERVAALDTIGAVDLIEGDTVVEALLALVAEMPQAVPLAGRLGVEGPDVVVDDARGLLVEVLRKGLAAEEGLVGLGVERPVEVDPGAGLDFAGGGGGDDGVGEAVERAELVGGAVSGSSF